MIELVWYWVPLWLGRVGMTIWVLALLRCAVEAAAEANEEFMEKYLEGGALTEEEIKKGLRIRTLASEIVPTLCGSAFKNKGVQAMLDAVIEYLPSPTEVKPIEGVLDDEVTVALCEADDKAPFAALALSFSPQNTIEV